MSHSSRSYDLGSIACMAGLARYYTHLLRFLMLLLMPLLPGQYEEE